MRRKIASIVVAMVLATSPAAAKPSKAWCAQQIASCTKAEADWLPLAQKYDRECAGKKTAACIELRSRERIAGDVYVNACVLLRDC